MGKVLSISHLSKVLKYLKKRKKTIVVTNGCFDILHAGHIEIFKQSKKLGDILITLVNSDKSISKLKGSKRPIIPLRLRLPILKSIKYIDYIVSFNELSPIKLYEKIKPNYLTKGNQYTINKIEGKNIIKKFGGKVKVLKMIPNISTSSIIQKIKNKW